MASVPRAARRGGKVEPSPNATQTLTPTLSSNTPPTMASPPDLRLPNKAPDSPVPAPPQAGADPDTPTFLAGQGSLLQFTVDATSHVAMGVVRGRGASQPVHERRITANADDVARRIDSAMASTLLAAPIEYATRALQDDANDVRLVDEATLAEQARDFALSTEGTRLLLVFPFADEGAVFAAKSPNAETATWFSNALNNLTTKSRVCITDIGTAQLHFLTTHGFKPFTHVAFVRCDQNPLPYHSLWSEMKEVAERGEGGSDQPRVWIGVFPGSHNEEVLSSYFAAAGMSVGCAGAPEPKCAVERFNADEVAAITKRPSLQVLDRNGQPTVANPRAVERVTEQATLLCQLLTAGRAGVRLVVFSGDPGFTRSAVAKVCDPSLQLFNSVASWVEGCERNPGANSAVFLAHAPLDVSVESLDAHVVIDLGTERLAVVLNKAEQTLPTRRVEWASHEEARRRALCCGQRRPALLFDLVPDSESTPRGLYAADTATTTAADGAVLQLSRLGQDILHVLHKAPAKPSVDAMEVAFNHLVERGLIASTDNHGITFAGEFVCRSGLSSELGLFVLNATVCGIAELGAVVAAIALHPIRPVPLPNLSSEDWVRSATEAMRKEGENNSDVIADTLTYLRWLESGKSANFPTDRVVDVARLELIEINQKLILHRISDFVVPRVAEASPVELRQLLERNTAAVEFLLSVSLAANAVTVKAEGLAGKTATGSLLFVRTAKEVNPSAFVPTTLKWKLNAIVVPHGLLNANSKVYTSGGSLLSQSFFFTALVLLSPTVEYSDKMNHKGVDCVCFAVTVNRQVKRFHTDPETAERILNFRVRWNAAYGTLQIKRSIPPKASRFQVLATLQSKDKKFDVEGAQTALLSDFIALVEQCDLKEYLVLFSVHNSHRLVPNPTFQIENVATASDVAICQLLAQPPEPPVDDKSAHTTNGAATAHPDVVSAAPSVAFDRVVFIEEDDDVEVEGTGFFASGPIVDDD